MADSRKELIVKINAQRSTVSLHVGKYNKFKANGDHTSTAETTIDNAQRIISALKSKDSSIEGSWEDNCSYSG